MRPGRLREIFDDAGNVVVALDQQHVAGLQGGAQGGIARREGLIALHRLFQIAGQTCPTPSSTKLIASSPLPGTFCLAVVFIEFCRNPLQFGSCRSRAGDRERFGLPLQSPPFAASEVGVAKLPETMTMISRRSFLLSAPGRRRLPCWAACRFAAEADVAIIGAGAAGIAAARRIRRRQARDAARSGRPGRRPLHHRDRELRRRRSISARIGSTCRTSIRSRSSALGTGLDVYPAPPGQKMRIGRRHAREGELEEFLSALVRANRAIEDAARGKADVSCAQALPKDLGDWQPAVEFVLGPVRLRQGFERNLGDGRFALDRARNDAFCRQGFGTLLAKLAEGLPVQLASPVTRIDTRPRGGFRSKPQRARCGARRHRHGFDQCAGGGKIKFTPELPKRQLDAASRLRSAATSASRSKCPAIRSGCSATIWCSKDRQQAHGGAARQCRRLDACPLSMSRAHSAASLPPRAPRAMTAFALEWLGRLTARDMRKAIGAARRRNGHLALCARRVLGGRARRQPSRRMLMEPLRDRVFFAGEAVHETLWGTVGGAWESGERAADAALKSWACCRTGRSRAQPSRSAPAGSSRKRGRNGRTSRGRAISNDARSSSRRR